MRSNQRLTQFSYSIDLTWCLDQLLWDEIITERDQVLVQTTHRNKSQLAWHPLQWIAQFDLVNQKDPEQKLTLSLLCQWLAEKPIYHFM